MWHDANDNKICEKKKQSIVNATKYLGISDIQSYELPSGWSINDYRITVRSVIVDGEVVYKPIHCMDEWRILGWCNVPVFEFRYNEFKAAKDTKKFKERYIKKATILGRLEKGKSLYIKVLAKSLKVEDLTEEQINAFGDFLEQNGSEDTVYTDTEINDMFWHDRDYVYFIVGWPGYPKVFKITHPDGRSVDVLVRSENEEQDLKGSLNVSSMTEIEGAGDGDEDVELEDFEAEEFESIKFWKITGPFGNTAIVKTEDDIDSDDLHNDEFMQCCKIEQLNSNQEKYINWLDYDTEEFTWNPEGKLLDECNIPVYAIPRICEKILNPDGSLDYYDVPESHAINMMNLNLELNDEDIKNIDGFVNNLNKKYPDGFDIKWDEPSIGSPYFDPKPEFGLACDCVTLRIYKK